MHRENLSIAARWLLETIEREDVQSIVARGEQTVELLAEIRTAGGRPEEWAANVRSEAMFRLLLMQAPRAKQDTQYAWRLLHETVLRRAPLGRLMRILPLLRQDVGRWQGTVLGLAKVLRRLDLAARILPLCQSSDIVAAEAEEWIKEVEKLPAVRSTRLLKSERRARRAIRLLESAENDTPDRFQSMMRSFNLLYGEIPERDGKRPSWQLMQAALRNKKPVPAASIVYAHTDILLEEFVACVVCTVVDGDCLDLLFSCGALQSFDWIKWRERHGGSSLLHLAAESSNVAFIERWVQKGGEIDLPDLAGNTPAALALAKGHLKFFVAIEALRGTSANNGQASCEDARCKVMIPVTTETAVNEFLGRMRMQERENSRIKRFTDHGFDERGYDRELVPAVRPEILDPLKESFPLFDSLIDDIQAQLSLLWRTSLATGKPQALRLTNTVIVGAPGWGKTTFINRLAKLLGLPFRPLQMSSMSAGFILSGSDPTWSSARPGLIHELLVNGSAMNPFVLLDEVDKISPSDKHPVDGPLFQLLEPEQACRFTDEFLAYPIDASHINWFASANELHAIHPAIVSRFEVYELPQPTPEMARVTARSVYRECLAGSPWYLLFDQEPSDAVVEVMASMSPREGRRGLVRAFGRASIASRSTISPDDFVAARRSVAKIGFIG